MACQCKSIKYLIRNHLLFIFKWNMIGLTVLMWAGQIVSDDWRDWTTDETHGATAWDQARHCGVLSTGGVGGAAGQVEQQRVQQVEALGLVENLHVVCPANVVVRSEQSEDQETTVYRWKFQYNHLVTFIKYSSRVN